MKITPKISIIVPVYNSGKYLQKCLDTLRFQTYENLEIICINDGSTDNSLDILNEYKKLDERISVYSQENSGVSAARNRGLEIASGDYISFIDSDDWVLLTLYKTFVDTISKVDKTIDIYMFNVGSYFLGFNDIVPYTFFKPSDWVNHKNELTIHTFADCMRPFSGNLSAANKIFLKEFLNKHDIVFQQNLKYEDQVFFAKSFLNADSIMFTDEIFYRYRNYSSGSATSEVSAKVFDIFKVIDLIENEIDKLGVYEDYKYAFFQYKFNIYTQHYSFCPEELKEEYFSLMKSRLIAAEQKNLEPKIYCRLRNYPVFELVRDCSWKQFDARIKQLKGYK